MITCDDVYTERNQLVAALTKFFPSIIVYDDEAEEGWNFIVYVHGPTGQMSWHIPNDEIRRFFQHLFAMSKPQTPIWDGHTTEEKYERLAQLESVWFHVDSQEEEHS